MKDTSILFHNGGIPDEIFCIEDTPQGIDKDGNPIQGDLGEYDEVRMITSRAGERAFFLLKTAVPGTGISLGNVQLNGSHFDIAGHKPRTIQGPTGLLYILSTGIVIDGDNNPFRCLDIDGKEKILSDCGDIRVDFIPNYFWGRLFNGSEFIFDIERKPIQVKDGRYIKSLTYRDFREYRGVMLSDGTNAYINADFEVLFSNGKQVTSIDRSSGNFYFN